MYSESTLDKIRNMERFYFGGVVERHNGGLIYSSDGSPVPIPTSPVNLNAESTALEVEMLFQILFP